MKMDQSAVRECIVCFADIVGKENDFTTEELKKLLQHCYPCLSSDTITHSFKHVLQSTTNNNDFLLCGLCFPLFLKLTNLLIRLERYKGKIANVTLTLSMAILQRRSLKPEKSIQGMEMDATNLPINWFPMSTSSAENPSDSDQQQEYFRKEPRLSNISVNQEVSNENVEYLAAIGNFGHLKNTEHLNNHAMSVVEEQIVRNDCSNWNTEKVTGRFFPEVSIENTTRSNGSQNPGKQQQNIQTPIDDIQNDIINRGGNNFQKLVNSPVPSEIVDFYCDYFPDGVPEQNNLAPLGIGEEEGINAIVEDLYNVELQFLGAKEETVRNKENAHKSLTTAVEIPSNAEMPVEGIGSQNNSNQKLDIVEIEILDHKTMTTTNETVVPASSDVNDAREILSVSNVRVGGENIRNKTIQNPNVVEIEILEEHLVASRNRPAVPDSSVTNNAIEILAILNLRPGRENFPRLPRHVCNRNIQCRKKNVVPGTSVDGVEILYVSTGLTNRKRTFNQVGISKDTELPAGSANAAPSHETIVSASSEICNEGKKSKSPPPSAGLSEATKTLPEVGGVPLPSITDSPKDNPPRRSCRNQLSKRKNACTLKCCKDGTCTDPKILKRTPPEQTTPEGKPEQFAKNQEKQLESIPEHQGNDTPTTTHSTSKASYQCSICKQPYILLKNLQNHEKKRAKGKPLQCFDCTEVFCTLNHLAKHRRIHVVRRRGKPE